MESHVKKYFNNIAHKYDYQHGALYFGFKYSLEKFYLPLLTRYIQRNDTIIEIGCGTGEFTKNLRNLSKKVIGIDISSNMINQAKQKNPDVQFYVHDCQDISSLNLNPDVIFGLNVFSYFPNKKKALKNYNSILSKKGRIVLIDMNPLCPSYNIMRMYSYNELNEFFPLIKQMTIKNLKWLFSRTGFNIIESGYLNFVHHRLNKLNSIPFILLNKLFSKSCINMFSTRIFLIAEKI